MQLINLTFLLVQLTFGSFWSCNATIELLWGFHKILNNLSIWCLTKTQDYAFKFFCLFVYWPCLPRPRILCLDSL
jgi:hypothetical protein